MANRTDDVTSALEDLLERERDAVMAGDLDGIARMADAKESLLARVPDAGTDPDVLERLRQLANRNAQLLAAAAQGLRAASARIKALAGGAELSTYDGAGRRHMLTSPAGTMVHKA